MNEPHPCTLDPQVLLTQCQTRRTRGRGPGGQHRNKVETAIILTHQPTGVEGQASERRKQIENQKEALFRLRVNLALEVRHVPTAEASPCWQQRCRGGRLAINPSHNDFPALLAELLDHLTSDGFDLKPTADRLKCSATQLVKLLKIERRALTLVNQQRTQQNLHPLR